jgi:hypothetical protein
LVKASFVCQDPWIAQAYYVLGKALNGHDPTVLENGRAGSTSNQCNYTNYGSWPDFPTLVRNVQNFHSPVAAPKPVTQGPTAQITSATITQGQPAVVRWTYSGTPSNCGSGTFVRMNGGNWGAAISLPAGQTTVDARYTNFAYPPNTRVNLTLFDVCLAKDISPAYAVTITAPTPVAPPRPVAPPPSAPLPTVTVRSFSLISAMGSRCLAVREGKTQPGTHLIVWPCLGTAEQNFSFMDDGTIRLFGGGNYCLDLAEGLKSGAHPEVNTCNGGQTQKWRYTNGNLVAANGLCLDFWGGSLMNGPSGFIDAQISGCNNGANQRFVAGITLPYGKSVNTIPPDRQASITPHGIPSIISHNGSAVIAISAGIVASGGGNIVASGGGNIVASGGGNIVASGGGNIVASGGGNIVASGGGNVIVPFASGIVASGGGN